MKITFPTIDLEISLSEVEYHYLKFICQETLQTSDEVLRLQLRQLQLPGVPDFDTWRTEQAQTPRLALPEATTTVDVQTAPAAVEDLQPSIDLPPSTEEEASPQPPASTAKKSRNRRSASPKQFDAKTLLPDFRKRSVQDAVLIVLTQDPDRSFGTDDLLLQIYGEFTDAELTNGRRSLGKVLSNGAKDGLWQRVKEKPPLYQAPAEATPATADAEE